MELIEYKNKKFTNITDDKEHLILPQSNINMNLEELNSTKHINENFIHTNNTDQVLFDSANSDVKIRLSNTNVPNQQRRIIFDYQNILFNTDFDILQDLIQKQKSIFLNHLYIFIGSVLLLFLFEFTIKNPVTFTSIRFIYSIMFSLFYSSLTVFYMWYCPHKKLEWVRRMLFFNLSYNLFYFSTFLCSVIAFLYAHSIFE